MKNKAASIYFDKDKTYLTITEYQNNEIVLLYLNSTKNAIDLYDVSSEISTNTANDLLKMSEAFAADIGQLHVTLHPKYTYIMTFPSKSSSDESLLKELLALEIANGFENKYLSDFNVKLIDIGWLHSNMLLAEFVPKEIKLAVETVLNGFECQISTISTSQLRAADAFMFNYPEQRNFNNLFIAIHQYLIEFMFVNDGKIANYEFVTDFADNIGDIISTKINQMMFNIEITHFTNIYFLGAGLNKSNFLELAKICKLFGAEAKRLNPFRMLKTELGQREQEYCKRIFHLFPHCIGAVSPSLFAYKEL